MGKRMETAVVAGPITGAKLYQQRARKALPVLVRQAHAGTPIIYSDLATELGMRNARNLNYVLGSIGETLRKLSQEWSEEIPPIQCLVVNKHTRLPGEGFWSFIIDKEDFRKLSSKQKRHLIDMQLHKIYVFPKWRKVLQTFGLKSLTPSYKEALSKASRFRAGGESKHHKKLKHFVAQNPAIVGLPAGVGLGQTEHYLPSGDSLDVLFVHGDNWVGIEVKPRSSPEADIIRGIFQCVKYKAVIEAYQASQELPQNARVVLILGRKFPENLVPLKHMLSVEVIDNVESE